MKAVVQRVSRARVTADGEVLGEIGRGLLVLVGVGPGDGPEQVRWMTEKLLRMRIFDDAAGKMNLSVEDVRGGLLLVSQFTLYADAARGNRPGFSDAAPPDVARPLFEEMVRHARATAAVPVAAGRFGAAMAVELVNDGPVTILLER